MHRTGSPPLCSSQIHYNRQLATPYSPTALQSSPPHFHFQSNLTEFLSIVVPLSQAFREEQLNYGWGTCFEGRSEYWFMAHIPHNRDSVYRFDILYRLRQFAELLSIVRILLLVFAVDVILSLPHFIQHTLGSSYELSFSGVWLQEFLFVGCHISLILGY